MVLVELIAAGIAILGAVLVFTTVALAPRWIISRVKPQLVALHSAVVTDTLSLQSERARVMGTIRALDNRRQAGGPTPTAREVEAAVAAAPPLAPASIIGAPPAVTQTIDVPDQLVAVAQGAGVDLAKVFAGDVGEIAKVKQLLAAVQTKGGGLGMLGGAQGGGRAPPPDDFL